VIANTSNEKEHVILQPDDKINVIVLDCVSQVRDAILMNVYLDVRNPGGSGFWNEGYMGKGREMRSSVYSNRRPRWTDPVTARRVPSK
jgi:hypothetical protein